MKELNDTVWATLKPSPVHGIGVFAIRDIPIGTKLYASVVDRESAWWIGTDELLPEIKQLVLQRWVLASKGAPYPSPNSDALLTSFMNHSDTPNYDYRTDRAMRDIKAGEEIFEDYGEYRDVLLKGSV